MTGNENLPAAGSPGRASTPPGDYYARLRLAAWWRKRAIRRATALVLGVGALGNEVVKNLAQLGVDRLALVDWDVVSRTDLCRSILFRAKDEGHRKVSVAARSVFSINPGVPVAPLRLDATWQIGRGAFHEASVVICTLDSVFARFAVNRTCALLGKPWLDGGLGHDSCAARAYDSIHNSCFECTLTERERRHVIGNASCEKCAAAMRAALGVPTTPVTASIVGALLAHEACNLIARRDRLALIRDPWYFDLAAGEVHRVELRRHPACPWHEPLSLILETELRAETATVRDILEASGLGASPRIEFVTPGDSGWIPYMRCPACHRLAPIGRPGYAAPTPAPVCQCPAQARLRPWRSLSLGEAAPGAHDVPVAWLGIPRFDVVYVADDEGRGPLVGFLRAAVLTVAIAFAMASLAGPAVALAGPSLWWLSAALAGLWVFLAGRALDFFLRLRLAPTRALLARFVGALQIVAFSAPFAVTAARQTGTDVGLRAPFDLLQVGVCCAVILGPAIYRLSQPPEKPRGGQQCAMCKLTVEQLAEQGVDLIRCRGQLQGRRCPRWLCEVCWADRDMVCDMCRTRQFHTPADRRLA